MYSFYSKNICSNFTQIYSNLVSGNAYIKIGKILIQWGYGKTDIDPSHPYGNPQFPIAYAAIPCVIVTPMLYNSTAKLTMQTADVTTTGFLIWGFYNNDTTSSLNAEYAWIAIGR